MLSSAVVRARRTGPRLVAGLAALVGLINLAAVLAPRTQRRIEFIGDVIPGVVRSASAGVSVAAALLLFAIATGLSRRKRRAWRLAIGVVVVMIVLQMLQGYHLVLISSAGLLVLLILLRDEFVGRGDPRTRWHAVRVFAALLVVSLAIGLLLAVFVAKREHLVTESIWTQLGYVLVGLVGVTTPLTAPDRRANDVLYWALLAMGVVTASITAYLALRSPQPSPRLTPVDEQAVRRLLATQGQDDSLGYFAIRDDKSVIWSPSGKACISYRVIAGTMLASGDPIGDPDAWPPAIEQFLARAKEYAWVPAAVACSELGAETWVRCSGLSALEFGDEAVIEAASFDLEGREMRNVRQMIARITRAGYTCQIRTLSEFTQIELSDLRELVARWRPGDTERGFSMAISRVDAARDPDCVVVTAHQSDQVRGVLVMVPWGKTGLSLDLMRRSAAADPGVNELMITTLLKQAPSRGIANVSLNFAVFREALERGERIGAGPIARLWGGLLLFASRWAQIESLYRFNAKFRPEWRPRFIVYPGAVGLPRVVMAYLQAEAFVGRPRLRSRLRRLLRPV